MLILYYFFDFEQNILYTINYQMFFIIVFFYRKPK